MGDSDKFCENCKKKVSAANYSLHSAHCHRNIGLCKVCNEPYPKNEIESHMTEAHTKKICNKCGQEFERQSEEKHMTEECSKRLVKCNICEIDIQECDLQDHIDYCGSRTELCNDCNCYVMLKFKDIHLSSNHAFRSMEDATAGPKADFSKLDLVSDTGANNSRTPVRNSMQTHSRLQNDLATDMLLNDLEYAHGHAFQDLLPEAAIHPSFTNDFHHLLNIDGLPRRRPLIPPLGPFAQEETSNFYRLANATSRSPEIVNDDIRIPCEVCGELVEPVLLMDHQETCNDERNNSLTRNNFLSRSFSSGSEESRPIASDVTLIPCEYCYKPFDADIIIKHQASCNMAENVVLDGLGRLRSPSINSLSPEQSSPNIVDDDTEYLDDLFLKEAIENSLKEEIHNEIPSANRTLNPNATTFLPKIRNVPIRIEGRPRALPTQRQGMELRRTETDRPNTERRDERLKQENSASNSTPIPPTRRRPHKE